MKKEPKVSAKQVLEALGGKDNIITVSHCATRLRLTIKDENLINKKAVEDAEGVAGYFVKSGQHQVIFGTGYVVKVCTEFKKLCQMDNDNIAPTQELNKSNVKTNKFQDITRTISDVFIPIIPVLLATGILMGLQGLITTLGYNMSAEFNSIFSVLTGTAYTFIPVLVTWSACKKFGGSPVLGIVLGLMLVSPILPDKWAVVNGAAEALKINIIGIDFSITGYQSSVIPALFLGWFCAFIENKLRKIVPDLFDMLLVPFLTLLISLLAGLFIVGPILLTVEQTLTSIILSLLKLPFGIGGAVYGGCIQLLCSVGMHHTVTPIIVAMFTETGVDYINPMGSAAIAGQLGAGLAILMLNKDKKTRAKMLPALIPALFGISEPVMYGITFPRIKPFLFGCIGGAVGGALASIFNIGAKGTGASMVPGMLLYLNSGLLQYIIVLIVSIAVAFAITYIVMKGKEK